MRRKVRYLADVSEVTSLARAIAGEIAKVIVGQHKVMEQVIVTVLADGHAVLEGVPGTAKTLLVKTLAMALECPFRRVQFTPDLMPSDIVGTNVFDTQQATFRLKRGPIFTSFLLADEINRTPPKTQAALLEAMEERQVTIEGDRYLLPEPFTVFATQNPVEYEGTYPLPEAQLDRFLMKIVIDYPEAPEEVDILRRYQAGFDARNLEAAGVQAVGTGERLKAAKAAIRSVRVDESVMRYITEIAITTRRTANTSLGASPRASVVLMLTSKCLAAIRGREFVIPDDVKELARPVLRHRLIVRPEAEIEGITPEAVVEEVLSYVPVPR